MYKGEEEDREHGSNSELILYFYLLLIIDHTQ